MAPWFVVDVTDKPAGKFGTVGEYDHVIPPVYASMTVCGIVNGKSSVESI
jgi:hypothetical protein